jgi:hypothetical protein
MEVSMLVASHAALEVVDLSGLVLIASNFFVHDIPSAVITRSIMIYFKIIFIVFFLKFQ